MAAVTEPVPGRPARVRGPAQDVAGLGIGRAGAIVGPVVGGEFIRRHWATRDIFFAAAVPAFISTVALLALRVAMARRSLRHADSDI